MIRIAVVEDDDDLLFLLLDLFAERGWEMLPCSSGSLALAHIMREAPDAILLDIRLETRVAGWEVLEQIRQDVALRRIPVIVWSGASDQLREKADWLAAQGIAVLEKPFDVDDLYRTIETALNGNIAQKTSKSSLW